MAGDIKLALSMRIARQGTILEVAIAAELFAYPDHPGAEDDLSLTVALEAVSAPSIGPQAADKHSNRRAGVERKALDDAEKPLGWKATKCVSSF